MPKILDMAESSTHRGLTEYRLRSDFSRQTGPVLQAEPSSVADEETPAVINLATYLDSDTDDDILDIGQNDDIDESMYGDDFIEFPRRRVSKRIDGEDISVLTQVNHKTAVQVCTVLHEMGVDDVIAFVADWPRAKFRAMENYISACIEFNLPFAMGDDQISAFLDKLDEAFYAASTLEAQWGTLKRVCHAIKFTVVHKHEVHYKAVKADCREVKDNKLPVSRELLIQLCEAALVVFTGYTACLVQAIFISAWAFSMRICEYCNVQVWKKPTDKFEENHNLRYSAIKVTKRGLTACFLSDKTSKAGDPIKRRSVFWRKLPKFAKPVMLAYKILRKGTNFFSKEDGTALDRNDFLNILELCLLHTGWCHLAVTPHSFRQGRASTEVNEGVSIEEIKHSCRWTSSSKAFDAYCRTDLVMMRPDAIYREYPQSRKCWKTKRLSWITRHFVQTSGLAEKHVHHIMLSEEFPEQFEEIKAFKRATGELPGSRMPRMHEGVTSGQKVGNIHKKARKSRGTETMEIEEKRNARGCLP